MITRIKNRVKRRNEINRQLVYLQYSLFCNEKPSYNSMYKSAELISLFYSNAMCPFFFVSRRVALLMCTNIMYAQEYLFLLYRPHLRFASMSVATYATASSVELTREIPSVANLPSIPLYPTSSSRRTKKMIFDSRTCEISLSSQGNRGPECKPVVGFYTRVTRAIVLSVLRVSNIFIGRQYPDIEITLLVLY